jgi:hypothetical protein
MVGSTSVKVPLVLGGLLKLQGLELSRESLLIPAIAVEAGSRGKGCQRWSGAWQTPGAGPLPIRPSDKGVGGLGRPS